MNLSTQQHTSGNADRTITFSEQVAQEEKKKSYDMSLQRWEQNLTVQTQVKSQSSLYKY